jgi:hypothetical protein
MYVSHVPDFDLICMAPLRIPYVTQIPGGFGMWFGKPHGFPDSVLVVLGPAIWC